ncbi:DUF4439 domain-containing protein [Cellulomonas sp. NPDC058312]|uniref:DUF4439 domain-containing protein n=1 Tax=Cellulomonas sp. NPDC058312 TaxID=3346441 RepID=UPI0036E4F80B
MPTTRHRHRHPLATRALAGALAAGTALLLTGCGARWETPPPGEPVPDAVEQARRTAVTDATELRLAAAGAAQGAAEPVAGVLALVGTTAATQEAALGGVYDSGLPAATPTPTATATATPATPAEVLALLGEAASAARTDARTATDPGLARLLASVAASRAQLVDLLAAALGVEAPAVDADPAAAADPGAAAASPSPSSSPTASPGPDPDAAGTDLGRATLVALVLAEDQAGQGFEVAAARLSDDDRDRARTAGAQHRAAASAWAAAAGVAGTADDPRRVSYAVEGDLTTPEGVRAACAALLVDLAAVHADAVLESAAGTTDRTAVVDGLRTSAVAALGWGAAPAALPGLPAVP